MFNESHLSFNYTPSRDIIKRLGDAVVKALQSLQCLRYISSFISGRQAPSIDPESTVSLVLGLQIG